MLPFSLLALCWSSVSHLFCLPQQRHGDSADHELDHDTSELDQELEEFEEMKRAIAFPTIKQKSILGCIWFFSSLYGLAACFPEKVGMM